MTNDNARRRMGLVLIFSLGANLLAAIFFCSFVSANRKARATLPFAITDMASNGQSPDYLVVFQDGTFWWDVGPDKLSMHAGVWQEMIMWLDTNNGRIKKTTVGLLREDGKEHD